MPFLRMFNLRLTLKKAHHPKRSQVSANALSMHSKDFAIASISLRLPIISATCLSPLSILALTVAKIPLVFCDSKTASL